MPGGSAAQLQVRETMLEAGGYWRPLAAIARLLEELGELAELQDEARPGVGELAAELADLWIITTALADQFRIEVAAPPEARPAAPSGTSASAAGLLVAAGRIARVVNYYDGPKLPRRMAEMPRLTDALGAFHRELERLCEVLEVDLARAVADKLTAIRASGDLRRFAREDSDPSTSPILALLPPAWVGRRLWGAPARAAQTPAGLAAALAPTLLAFTRAARAEGLDGYVIAAPHPPLSAELGDWLAELAAELCRLDGAPAESPAAREPQRLRFNGLELEVEVLPTEPGAPAARALLVLRHGVRDVLDGPAEHGA